MAREDRETKSAPGAENRAAGGTQDVANAGKTRPDATAKKKAGRTPRPTIALGTLDVIFGLHVGLAHSAIMQDFKRSVEPIPLTPKQASLLWLANEHPGLAQVDVARLLLVDRATMLGITNSLVKRGLIERRPPLNGGRRVALHLTPDGSELLARAKQAIARHEERLQGRFTDEELRITTDVLKRIHGVT